VSGKYTLAATYCEPDSGPGSKPLQLLTHGIGFDRSYWDLSADNYAYSYVNAALAAGYRVFSYDRLGIGHSSHGSDPVNEIQSSLEIESLAALTRMLRSGSVPDLPTSFDKIVHVGHSFGSIQSYTLAQLYPDLSDGLVLTGFSQNPSWVPYFAIGSNFISVTTIPGLKESYDAGYFVPGDLSGLQFDFFAPGNFDPALLPFAYQTGQPVSVGELLTTLAGTGNSSTFAGPVLIITGGTCLSLSR